MSRATEVLATRYRDRLNVVRSTTTRRAAAVWAALPTYTGDEIEEQFLRIVAPLIQTGIAASTQLTEAYLVQAVELAEGQPLTTRPAVQAKNIASLRGLDDVRTVLRRPLVTVWTDLSKGRQWADAVSHGGARLEELTSTSIQLAARDTADIVGERLPTIQGYRRTLTGSSCWLCAAASTQRYRRANLMPIHPHCDCGISPIVGTDDPGRIVNRDLYRQLRESGGGQYWQQRGIAIDEDGNVLRPDGNPLAVRTQTHGELGPVLTDAEHRFESL
jgi:hypothetical protein